MAPGYIETPYDFTDKRWYTPDGDPRTIRTDVPGSIASHVSSSSVAPSFKTYHTEHNSPDPSLKKLHDAYRSLPSLDYEYRPKPKAKAVTKPKAINRSSEAGPHMRPSANARSISNKLPAIANRGRGNLGGTAGRHRENVAPTATGTEDLVPQYEYEVRHRRAHAAPVYETIDTSRVPQKVPLQRPSRLPLSMLDTSEIYDQQRSASWYRPPPLASTPALQDLCDLPPKETASWYRLRPEKTTTKGLGLRKSKAKVNRVSGAIASLAMATPMRVPQRGVKTWYAGVRRKLFRKSPKV